MVALPVSPAGDDPAAGLTVGQVAARLGVPIATLRTWERRYGLHPSRRTSGGHRRYAPQDVALLGRLHELIGTGLPAASAAVAARSLHAPAGPRATDRAPLADRLAAAVGVMDLGEAARLASRIVGRFGVVSAWTDVFVPLLQDLGLTWERTGTGVEREHLGAVAIQTALLEYDLRRRKRVLPGPPVLAAATPGEGHTLPLDALSAACAESGIASCMLGTLPPTALHDAVRQVLAGVLVLWARSEETADYDLLRSLAGRVPQVCAAGPGWRRRQLPRRVAHARSLEEALGTVLAWRGQAARA